VPNEGAENGGVKRTSKHLIWTGGSKKNITGRKDGGAGKGKDGKEGHLFPKTSTTRKVPIGPKERKNPKKINAYCKCPAHIEKVRG